MQVYQKQMKQELSSIMEMRREVSEYRNKLIIMKENEFQYFINSFINRIKMFGNRYEEN
jgi:hypothetical protein